MQAYYRRMPTETLVIITFTIAVFTYVFSRLLNLTDSSAMPIIHCKNQQFLQSVLKFVPILSEPYVPVGLWGKNGHLQTIIHATLGRMGESTSLIGERKTEKLPDGATVTFDIFQPLSSDISKNGCTTLLICPGIANCSESNYVRVFVKYAQTRGYRCIVLNHLGTLPHVNLTSPRIFTYGGIEEFDAMVHFAIKNFTCTKFVVVGWSMGGNVITKYLGEKRENYSKILCGISVCQGYDADALEKVLSSKTHNWNDLWQFYQITMLGSLKRILKRYSDVLFTEKTIMKYQLNLKAIFDAQSLRDFDEKYTRKIAGFSSVRDFYNSISSANFMDKIEVPMLFINALDDPLVPHEVLIHPKNFAESHENSLFILTKHGGHLGFFEGGSICPNKITWKDKIVIDYIDGLLSIL